MGRTSKDAKLMMELSNQFKPLELNEGEVQAIFHRCLAKPNCKETSSSVLFSTMMGFSSKDVRIIDFDKEILLANKKNIEYLYGQLDVVHKSVSKSPIADFISTYNGGFGQRMPTLYSGSYI